MKKTLILISAFALLPFTASAQDTETTTPAKEEVVAENKDITSIEAVIKTTKGDIHIKLYADKTPVTVANFCNLALRGYYQETVFHRVIPGFVSQAGQHKSGSRDPGYTINNETYTENPEIKDLKHDKKGMLSMARLPAKHTNGSQFYITHAPTPHLDGDYTVFGEVTEGLDIALGLETGTKVTDVIVSTDVTKLFKQQAVNVTKWNTVLDNKFLNLRDVNVTDEVKTR